MNIWYLRNLDFSICKSGVVGRNVGHRGMKGQVQSSQSCVHPTKYFCDHPPDKEKPSPLRMRRKLHHPPRRPREQPH